MLFRSAIVLALLAASEPLLAQTLPTRVVRRGPTAGLELSDGEPISFFLEHARQLRLTETQRTTLMEIRRRLRRETGPLMQQIDSLREHLGISMEPGRMTREDYDALARLDTLSKPIVDSVKIHNDAAHREGRALLDPDQRAKLDSIVLAEREFMQGRRPPPPGRR